MTLAKYARMVRNFAGLIAFMDLCDGAGYMAEAKPGSAVFCLILSAVFSAIALSEHVAMMQYEKKQV